MLPVSLDCPFLITPSSCVPYVASFSRLSVLITPSSCVPYVASFSGLSVFDYPFVLCTLCCQFLWIVRFWLPLRLVYPMLPVSLDCPFLITPSSCIPYVISFSGFSVFHYPFVLCTLCCQFLWIVRFWLPLVSCVPYPFVLCTLCCQFLWIVRFWLPLRLVYPMLPVSLDCQFLITPSSCVPYVASFSGLSVCITPSSCVPYVASFSGLSVLITPSSCVPYVASFSGLSFDYPFVLLPVSLNCLFPITPSSCVPNVASFSGLSVSDYPFVLCTLCCQFLWIVRFWLPLRLV